MEDVTLRLRPEDAADMAVVRREAIARAGSRGADVHDCRIVRRSIDARQRQVMVNLTVRLAMGDEQKVTALGFQPHYRDVHEAASQMVIVGSGPAGLFAALKCLQMGVRPIVLERGGNVDERRIALASMSRTGIVDPEMNYSFGEGGAGTYSDGKLYTRSKKRGSIEEVLGIFHHHGASEDILIDAHPHIGSDRLPLIIKDMRETIIRHGGEVRFHSKVVSLSVDEKEGRRAVVGATLASGETVKGPVILATGHSARDVYRMLKDQGIPLEAKGLAIGTRLEHSQHLIDCLQYHSREGRGPFLPPAEYSYVCQSGGRGVYSFCMCPGGIIVPAPTEPGQCVVNGMSPSNRGSKWANAGMVVELHPGDIEGFADAGALEMMELQEHLEHRFFEASQCPGRNPLSAPAQRMSDFVEGRDSSSLPRSSYAPGVHAARLDKLLPPQIADRLRDGYRTFGRRCRGFLTDEAMLVGLESRTSSPVRIPRDAVAMSHSEVDGLYPAGEGAGYAGGIVSAAIDGIRCAEACAATMEARNKMSQ